MQLSDLPRRFPIPFADGAGSAYIRAIPTDHVTPTSTDAPASLHDGFPPETFVPLGSGGVPPNGADFNGILNQLSAWARWMAAGGVAVYDATFQTAIGGYPRGAVVGSAATPGRSYRSTAENNMTNPDASGAGWMFIDQLIAQDLTDNRGYRIWDSGFKETWGYNNLIGAGETQTITFADFMPAGMAFSVFQRFTLGSSIPVSGSAAPAIGIMSTTKDAVVVRNSGTVPGSYQWSTRGV